MLFGKRQQQDKRPLLDLMGDVGTIGTHMVACTFVGLAIGYYLDKWLGTKPVMLLIFLVAGIAAGFKNMYDQARRMQKRVEDETRNDQRDAPED
ncbi:AtpZ/AtpI family protein [Desulfocurvus sp. DL9XJH121]